MPPILLAVGIAVGAVALFVLGWRFLARRLSLPCPAALIWMLENRIMERVAGSGALIQRGKVQRGMRVLDAGCGPGRVAIPLAEYVGPEGEVVALDIQVPMLARLADRMAERGVRNIRTIRAGLGQGALEGEHFDRALMVTVLGEIPDRLAALKEIHGALKPGGLLSITEVLPDPHYQSRRTVRTLGQQAGFEVEQAYSGIRSFTMNLIRPFEA